jgi:anti-sigma B factor antagonist
MPETPRPFSLTSARTDDQAVLSVSGEIDIATVGEFAAAAREQLAAGTLLLDLHGVTFMDSSGLRALIALLRECEQEGWSLMIGRDLHRNVRQLLEMTGMLGALPLQDLGSAP